MVADRSVTLVLSGNGDVVEPEHPVTAIGSGGPYALAAARVLYENSDLDARAIVEKSLQVAAEICIYTNEGRVLEELGPAEAGG